MKGRTATLRVEIDKPQDTIVNAEKFRGIVKKHLAVENLKWLKKS